jgi:uncharacterized protein
MGLTCFFVSDLHGRIEHYKKLFKRISIDKPAGVFIGGDLLPSPYAAMKEGRPFFENFIEIFLLRELSSLRSSMGNDFPDIFVILGNDDARSEEPAILEVEQKKLWSYCHMKRVSWKGFDIFGYSYIPPSPFRLKDWERYDISDFVRPGCIAPEDGAFTVQVDNAELRSSTIENDLLHLSGNGRSNVRPEMERSIFLFHSPPHGCNLDRAALDGHRINEIQVDVHVGSSAIRRFIESRKPRITLHGHIHESTRLTGSWRDSFGDTHSFNASHDGPELSLIRFDPEEPVKASRVLI